MKKIIIIAAIIIALAAAFLTGSYHGKMHTIRNAEFYIVSYDDEVEFNGTVYDTSLFIEIDGNVYEQGLYVC